MSGGGLFNAATASSEKGGNSYADARRGSEGILNNTLKNQVLDEKSRIFALSKENLAIVSDKGETKIGTAPIDFTMSRRKAKN
jgi:hypothetical protein